MKWPSGPLLSHKNVAAAIALLVVATGAGCARTGSPEAASSWPKPGTIERSPGGGVTATGIVVRYPVFDAIGGGGLGTGTPWKWVLISDTGALATPPAVMANLEASSSPTERAVYEDIKAGDGKLVTVVGRLRLPETAMPFDRLAVERLVEAPGGAQLGLFPKEGLIQPGEWYRQGWRAHVARLLGELADKRPTRYADVREAQAEVGRPLQLPSSSLAGTLAAVYVDPRPDRRRREATLLSHGGLWIVEAAKDTRPVYRWQKLYSRPYRRDFYYWGHIEETTTARPPDYAFYVERLRDEAKSTPNSDTRFELARIGGRPGIWGPDYVQWWDGTSFITIRYGGPPSGAPTRQDLLEIARSMKPVE
jgi:hypothetical protein